MKIQYNLVANDGELSSVTAICDGRPLVAVKEHKTFDRIVATLAENDRTDGQTIKTWDDLRALFDVSEGLNRAFNDALLSERVAIRNGTIFIDQDPFSDPMAAHIIDLYTEGKNFKPMVRFLEKAILNPNKHSREQMFKWLDRNHFVIADDGDILAYKGVNRMSTGGFQSSNAGEAWVNGVLHTGCIPTSPGSIVEMPRSKVNHNPSIGCSTGLHAGDWSYAKEFAPVVLLVKINPRDVVSVPTDSGERKMRVCRYLVLHEVTEPIKSMTVAGLDDRILVTPPASDTAKVGEDKHAAKPTKAETAKKKAVKKAERAQAKVIESPKKPAVKVDKAKVAKATKTAAAKKAERIQRVPSGDGRFYEDFRAAMFETLTVGKLKWVLDQWEVTYVRNATKQSLVKLATKAAENRRRRFNRSVTPPAERDASKKTPAA